MESVIFLASLVVKKGIVCLPFPEKEQVRQQGWLQFLIPAGCWPEASDSVEWTSRSEEWTSRSRRLA